MVRGRAAHWLSTLKSILPRLNELRRLLRYLVSLLSRSGTPHVTLCVALAAACRALLTQGANSVIDVTFSPGVVVCNTSSSPPVDRHVLLYFRGLPLYFECSLQRLLCIHAWFFMSCTAVANFPEGVAKLNACGFMCSPTIREVFGCRGQWVSCVGE